MHHQLTLNGKITYDPISMPKPQYLGSKELFAKWIIDEIPKDSEIVLDGFSGSSIISFELKKKKKQVISNDFLKFNYHIAKALIENKRVKLNKNDVDLLFTKNQSSDNLMQNLFSGIYFSKEDMVLLDNFRSQIKLLSEYKKSLAYSVMCRSLTFKIPLGHFAHLKGLEYAKDPKRFKRSYPQSRKSLKSIFLNFAQSYNKIIFNNKKDNIAYNQDILSLLPSINADVAYYDPPYVLCHPKYQSFYHLLETFVNNWQDKTYLNKTNQYFPQKETLFNKKSTISLAFHKLFKLSKHIETIIVSYNSNAYPPKSDMLDIIKQYRNVHVKELKYNESIGGKGITKNTKEYLFICK